MLSDVDLLQLAHNFFLLIKLLLWLNATNVDNVIDNKNCSGDSNKKKQNNVHETKEKGIIIYLNIL